MRKKINVNKIAQLTGHNSSIYALAAGEEDHLFLSGSGDGWIVEWNLNDSEIGKLLAKAEANVFSLFIKNKKIVAGNMNGGIHWIHPQNTESNKNVAHHEKGVFDVQVIGSQLFTVGGKGLLTKWSYQEQRAMESIQLSYQSLRSMSFFQKKSDKENGKLAVGASDNNIYILDFSTFEMLHTIENAHDNSVFAVQFSPDGKYLLSGGRDAHLKVWEVEKNYELISSQPAHWYTINDIAYHPDAHLFATASRDRSIKIWDAENFQLLKVLDANRGDGHVNSVNKLLWSKHKNWLISGSDDRSLIIWEIEEEEISASLNVEEIE